MNTATHEQKNGKTLVCSFTQKEFNELLDISNLDARIVLQELIEIMNAGVTEHDCEFAVLELK